MTGDEFKWNFAIEKDRIQAVYSALPFDKSIAEGIIAQVEDLESLENIDSLIHLLLSR